GHVYIPSMPTRRSSDLQVFEAIGLAQDFVDRYFTATPSRLGGIGIDVVAKEVADRHASAYPRSGNQRAHEHLPSGGEYQWRRDRSEEHTSELQSRENLV